MRDEEITAPIAEMLVRCGIERGQLGRIDADNVARILLPVVRKIADQRAAEAWETALGFVGDLATERGTDSALDHIVDEFVHRATALRGEARL